MTNTGEVTSELKLIKFTELANGAMLTNNTSDEHRAIENDEKGAKPGSLVGPPC